MQEDQGGGKGPFGLGGGAKITDACDIEACKQKAGEVEPESYMCIGSQTGGMTTVKQSGQPDSAEIDNDKHQHSQSEGCSYAQMKNLL